MQAAIDQAENERRYADKEEEQQENDKQLQSYADHLKATGSTGAATSEGDLRLRQDRPGLLPAVLGEVLPVPAGGGTNVRRAGGT